MENKVEISLNDKTEVKINGVKIPYLTYVEMIRDAKNIGTTSLKLEFDVPDSEITFY